MRDGGIVWERFIWNESASSGICERASFPESRP